MRNHVKIYLDHFEYDKYSFVPCEICGAKCNDVHHIDCKGMGGSKEKDYIENLIGVCRDDHIKYGDKKQHIPFLNKVHKQFMKTKTPYNQ
jgi:hypothetical protein